MAKGEVRKVMVIVEAVCPHCGLAQHCEVGAVVDCILCNREFKAVALDKPR